MLKKKRFPYGKHKQLAANVYEQVFLILNYKNFDC